MTRNKNLKLPFWSISKMIAAATILLVFLKSSESSSCQNFNYVPHLSSSEPSDSLMNNGKITIANYTCPGKGDPELHTECCNQPGMRGCCPISRHFYEIDRDLASTIAISVICSCIFLTVSMAICCFWSKCPLYTACKAEFTPEIATYVSKDDDMEMDAMPRELSGRSFNKFSPVVVSNGNVRMDDDNNAV